MHTVNTVGSHLKGVLTNNSDDHFTFVVTMLGNSEENKNFFVSSSKLTVDCSCRATDSRFTSGFLRKCPSRGMGNTADV